jgi:hypothetical protein
MPPLRREKALVALLFWTPPALARLRETALLPPPSPTPAAGASTHAETPTVAALP